MHKYKETEIQLLEKEKYKDIKYIIKMDFGYKDYYFGGDGYISQTEEPEGTILFVSKSHDINIDDLINFSVYALGIHPYKKQGFNKVEDTFFEDYISDEKLKGDFHFVENSWKNTLNERKTYTNIVVLDLDGENILYNKLEYKNNKEIIQQWIDENLNIGYKVIEEEYIKETLNKIDEMNLSKKQIREVASRLLSSLLPKL